MTQSDYFIVEMPLNDDGQGPEMDPAKVVRTVWEVWDWTFKTIAEFSSQEDAIAYVNHLKFVPDK